MEIHSQALLHSLAEDLKDFLPEINQEEVWPDIDYRTFCAHSLFHNFLSKSLETVETDSDQKALDKFLACDSACGEWVLKPESSKDEVLIGTFKRALDLFFNPGGLPLVHSLFDLLDHGRMGSGSSVGAEGTSMYAKLFSSDLTTTDPSLYEIYELWIEKDETWSVADRSWTSNYHPITIVEGSRISFVPKKRTISRTICVEPSLNMFFQLGYEEILRDRLKHCFGIDLKTQADCNRELARRGSVDGSLATIDLASASDSISMEMCREVLPPETFRLLTKLRSPKVEIEGEQHTLSMISSMGNGFTFPLETILFMCVVEACYNFNDIELKKPMSENSNYGVFGDDIIVETGVFRDVLRLLSLLGFSVNESKTFVEGPFRESCGADWFNGLPTRPIFCKDLSSVGTRYALINNLNDWSAKVGIYLPATVSLLLSSVKFLEVPADENYDSGIRVPFNMVRSKTYDSNGSSVYYRYVARSAAYRIEECAIKQPKGFSSLMYNPNGLLICALNGSIAGSRIPVRLDSVHYRPKIRRTPFWDRPVSEPSNGLIDWGLWNTALHHNLQIS